MFDLSTDIDTLKSMIHSLFIRIEQLEADNAALRAENATLRAENAVLRAENAMLKDQLSKNSKNSHKPPSSDGYGKKPALPQSSGKKTGGQFGHTGRTLKMVSTPDHIVVHHISSCPCCQKPFSRADVNAIGQKRQVFDLPEPRLIVTEHQQGIIHCCGQVHKGTFPEQITQPVQYGSKIRSLSVLLNNDYKLPIEKIEQLFADIYGCSFNESTALSTNQMCYDLLAPTENFIKTQVLGSKVVNFDETGMRVAAKLHWFHTASTNLFTYLFVHTHRGKKALEDTESLIKDFKNRAVHDCWASYFAFNDCSHSLCNAHIVRELQALIENGSLWAVKMKQFLLDLYEKSLKATIVVPNKDEWVAKFNHICQIAHEEEPQPTKAKNGKFKNSKGRNLLNRLRDYQNGITDFAFDIDIPFTNNQAERDIRCLKTKQKVAMSFRTLNGAKHFARIQSFISSVRKHNSNVFQAINDIFNQKGLAFWYA
jgi:transposase